MTAIEVVALTLLHFVWQGTLVHLALVMLLGLARPRAANTRYIMSLAALGLMAIAPVVTSIQLTRGSFGAAVAPPVQASQALSLSPIDPGNAVTAAAPVGAATISAPVRELMASVPPLASRLPWLMPWLVAVWLTGVIALAVRLLGGWLRLRALVDSGLLPEARQYDDVVARLRERLHVTRAVRVLESARVMAPAISGWLRPVLLVPASLSSGLTTQQLETILAHELAHIRRHDYAVNLLQSVIETLLFYHPSIWLVSSRIREEREHCCDDLAVRASGDARIFASALLELENKRLASIPLAMAATGGTLLRRVRRLLTPAAVQGEGAEGSRLFAGVFVLAAILVVTSGATLLRADAQRKHAGEEPNEAMTLVSERQSSIASAAALDTVIIYRGSEALDARVRWAHDMARQRQLAPYWVGYSVAGDIDRGWIYFNRHSPVRAGGGTMISGRFRMKEPSGLTFSGTRLATLVPPRPESDVAILYRFAVRNGRAVVDRMHAANFIFPVPLEGSTLVWLGQAEDAQSIALAQRMFASVVTNQLREDIAGIVGVHTASELVRPVLSRWLQSAEDDGFRAEVVELLGEHADAQTLGLLTRTAREDRSSRVRAEAAETVGEVDLPAALDTLIAMAETLTDHNARREAVEAFGHRSENRALEALRQIVQRDQSLDIQRQAVETMGEIETERALALITEIAREHRNSEIRREAVETLGDRAPMDDLLRILRQVIEDDPSVDVKREAVETLAERDGQRVLELLAELAERHPDSDVQREATESLGDASPPEQARRILERIVRTHQRNEVRREAIEALADQLPPDSGAVFFGAVVQGDNTTDLKLAALEALSDMKGSAALDAILEAARAHPDRRVRRKAIELLGESDDPRARAMLERILTRP